MNTNLNDTTTLFGFILGFIGIWVGINALLSLASGWFQLSKRFPSSQEFKAKQTFRLTSISLGVPFFPISYRNCVNVSIGETGIKISILFFFRFLSSPLELPWREIGSITQARHMFINSVIINIKNENRRIRFYGNVGKAMTEISKQKGIKIQSQGPSAS